MTLRLPLEAHGPESSTISVPSFNAVTPRDHHWSRMFAKSKRYGFKPASRIDEHPDSINDGACFMNTDTPAYLDFPGSYHGGACGLSFADGHSEIRKWRSANTVKGVKYQDWTSLQAYFAPGVKDPDLRWLVGERTPGRNH